MPSFTCVYVPSQRSATSHSVPSTVAELLPPTVRKLPFPVPHRLRTTVFVGCGFFAAGFGFAAADCTVRIFVLFVDDFFALDFFVVDFPFAAALVVLTVQTVKSPWTSCNSVAPSVPWTSLKMPPKK